MLNPQTLDPSATEPSITVTSISQVEAWKQWSDGLSGTICAPAEAAAPETGDARDREMRSAVRETREGCSGKPGITPARQEITLRFGIKVRSFTTFGNSGPGPFVHTAQGAARFGNDMKTTLAAVFVLFLATAPGWATLGQPESSISLDQEILSGRDRESIHPGYKLHEITTADGALVREFVSPAGVIFGVAWQGSHMPSLQQLLGSHMADLETALQSKTRRPGRAPLIVRTDKLVFVSGGHMRAFHGYAYIPGLVPANVSPERVQ